MKNTAFLAIRMVFTLGVSLYTSRVVLQQLGVEDFGIYSVVAGLVLIIAFTRAAITSALQRFMNVELAMTGGRDMQKVFAASMGCIVLLIVGFVILAELVGLWYVNNKLNVPVHRLGDARVVFQLSLVIVVIEMLRIPYNSLIIAHERMSFYAYNSILEAVLKLVVAVLLIVVGGQKLFLYMYFLIGVALLINVSYVLYCRKILPDVRLSMRIERRRIVEIGKFAGWNVVTSLSDIMYQQGSAMILNVFYGVTLNATMGVANQVKGPIFSFTNSIQSAANPQIIQTFAAGQQSEFMQLFVRVSKISFLCLAFVGIPVFLNSGYVLSLWLVDIPPMASIFVQLMIVFCLVDSLVGPLWTTIQASGRIAWYNIVVSGIWLLCLPVTYLAYRMGGAAYSLIVVMIVIDAVLIVIRVWFTWRMCGVPKMLYLREVVCRVALVLAIALAVPLALIYGLEMEGLERLLVTTGVWVVMLPLSAYVFGMTPSERGFVMKLLKR